MKKTILLVALILHSEELLHAQESLLYQRKTYVADLKDSSGKWLHGYLAAINDSSLTISIKRSNLQIPPTGVSEQGHFFSYREIEKLELKRRGSAGRGALIGGLTGSVALGSFAAFLVSVFDISHGGGLIAMFAYAGLNTGALIGAFVGEIIHQNFKIQGKSEKFNAMRNKMIIELTR